MPLPNVYRWTARVMVDGVDVSARATESIKVEAEEGAARVCDVSIFANPGDAPTDYMGSAIEVYYQDRTAAGALASETLLFRGTVDEPTINLETRVISFSCTDGLQAVIEAMDKPAIDALTGGYWHASLYRADADPWTYARDRMASRTASLELDLSGAPVVREWTPAAVPNYTFDAGDVLEDTARIVPATQRDLINQIVCVITVRRARQWQREQSIGWTYSRSFTDYLRHSTTLPNKTMARQALAGTGWQVAGVSHTEQPESQTFTIDGSPVVWIKDEPQLLLGFSGRLVKRWLQTIASAITVTIDVPASQARHGILSDEIRANLSSTNPTDWEALELVEREPGRIYLGDIVPDVPGAIDAGNGYLYVDALDEPDALALAETVVEVARTRLYAAHRRFRAPLSLPIVPTLDRHQTVAETGRVTATGTVRRVVHELDFDAGTAISRVELAVLRGGSAGAGAFDPFTMPGAPATPTIPDDAAIVHGSQFGQEDATTGPHDDTRRGYSGNYDPPWAGSTPYPLRLKMSAPEIPAIARTEQALIVPVALTLAIPDQALSA